MRLRFRKQVGKSSQPEPQPAEKQALAPVGEPEDPARREIRVTAERLAPALQAAANTSIDSKQKAVNVEDAAERAGYEAKDSIASYRSAAQDAEDEIRRTGRELLDAKGPDFVDEVLRSFSSLLSIRAHRLVWREWLGVRMSKRSDAFRDLHELDRAAIVARLGAPAETRHWREPQPAHEEYDYALDDGWTLTVTFKPESDDVYCIGVGAPFLELLSFDRAVVEERLASLQAIHVEPGKSVYALDDGRTLTVEFADDGSVALYDIARPPTQAPPATAGTAR